MKELNLKEKGVLQLMVEGKTNREIADFLQISEGYTEILAYNIFNKLGCRNRTEAAVRAVKEKLVEI